MGTMRCSFNKPLWLEWPYTCLCDGDSALKFQQLIVARTTVCDGDMRCSFNKPLWLERPYVTGTMRCSFNNNSLWLEQPYVTGTMRCCFNR